MNTPRLPYDVVMEGGGVKALGLVGALTVLEEHGYEPRRVAGTSTGAIVGALLAAGMTPNDMHLGIAGIKYDRLRDENVLDKFGPVGKMISLVVNKGVYEGNYIHGVIDRGLRELGVRTFGDLAITEPWGKQLPPEQRYKLVVIAADVTSGQLVRLPWDYRDYGLDPDKQKVSDAIRASMSIPFFYKPYRLKQHLLVDGSILSRFPIDLFDMTPEWPTFGLKLWAKPGTKLPHNRTGNIVEYGQAVLSTMLGGRDQLRYDDPATLRRTVHIDTLNARTTDFDLGLDQLEKIYVSGRRATQSFLKTWDYEQYKTEFLSN